MLAFLRMDLGALWRNSEVAPNEGIAMTKAEKMAKKRTAGSPDWWDDVMDQVQVYFVFDDGIVLSELDRQGLASSRCTTGKYALLFLTKSKTVRATMIVMCEPHPDDALVFCFHELARTMDCLLLAACTVVSGIMAVQPCS